MHPRHTPALALRVARSAPVQQARGAAALAAERPSARMLASLLSRTRTRRDVGGRHSPARLWCSARIADEIVDYCSVAMRESRAPDRGFGDCLKGRDATARRLLPLAAASPGIAITSESRTSLSHLVQRRALDRRSQSCGFGYTQKRRPSRPLSVEAEARWVSDQTTAPERIEP